MSRQADKPGIHAVVLAAGESRRMGRQKLLLPLGPTTIIRHVVGEVVRSGLQGVSVVVGLDREALTQELTDLPVSIIVNPHPEEGMLSSVRCGLRSVPPKRGAVLVVLGDQPSIGSGLVSEMVGAFRETGKRIVVPCFNGKRGHPLLFSLDYRDEILRGYDRGGLRELLRAHPEDVLDLNAESSAVLRDVDFPEDYKLELEERARKAAERPDP